MPSTLILVGSLCSRSWSSRLVNVRIGLSGSKKPQPLKMRPNQPSMLYPGMVSAPSLRDLLSSYSADRSMSVTDIDLPALYDDSKSLNEGALTIPGYSMDGWYGRIFGGCGFFDPDKPIRTFTKRELHDLLHKEPTKIKVDGINLTYEGLIPKIQKSMLSKDVDSLQPHIRAFVERAVTFTTCPECGGPRLSAAARSSKVKGISIADACAMQISDLAEWLRALEELSLIHIS